MNLLVWRVGLMNDFTKEELESIRNQIFSCMGSSQFWRNVENNNLVEKLQSMINKYCEHKNMRDIYHARECADCGVIE